MDTMYRYMIWNDVKKEYQFPSICETTEKGAYTCLFNKIDKSILLYTYNPII